MSLFGGFQFTGQPTQLVCLHRIGCDLSLIDMAAGPTTKSPVLETESTRSNTLDRCKLLALRTAWVPNREERRARRAGMGLGHVMHPPEIRRQSPMDAAKAR